MAGSRLVWKTRWASLLGGIASPLLQRRERRRHHDLRLLRQQLVAAARGRPDPGLARLLAHLQPLVHGLVGPDVDEAVGAAELHAARGDQRGEPGARGQRGLPALHHAGQRAGGQAVAPDLEDRADRPRGDVGHERERVQHLHALVHDELADLGRPVGVLGRLGADARPLGQVLVAPHVDDLVERPDLGVPEGGQRRVLLAVLVGLSVALLDLGQAAGLERVGAELVDHRPASCRAFRGSLRPKWGDVKAPPMLRCSPMARDGARFGIVFLPERFDGWGDLCRETEDAGFDWLGVADSQSVFRELYVALTLAVLHTRRLRLGPLVTNPLTRHLVVTASAMASVDEVAGGRAVLGLGSGDSAIHTIGAPPATLAGLEESIVTLGRLTAGETIERAGGAGRARRWRVHRATRRIPIYLAAEGPRTLELAGRVADGVIVGLGIAA